MKAEFWIWPSVQMAPQWPVWLLMKRSDCGTASKKIQLKRRRNPPAALSISRFVRSTACAYVYCRRILLKLCTNIIFSFFNKGCPLLVTWFYMRDSIQCCCRLPAMLHGQAYFICGKMMVAAVHNILWLLRLVTLPILYIQYLSI